LGAKYAFLSFHILSVLPDIIVADTDNHRVLQFSPGVKDGKVIAGGNGEGDELNQLCVPCGVAVDSDGSLIIADCGNDRVVRWTVGAKEGTVVAGGNGEGKELNQLSCPCGVAVTKDGTIIVGDCGNHRAVAWAKGAKEGRIVAGGKEGSALSELSSPNGVAVDEEGAVYIADIKNDRVVKWAAGAKEGVVVAGGKGAGPESDKIDGPCGVAMACNGDVLISERGSQVRNFRVTRWSQGAKEGTSVAGGTGQAANGSRSALECLDMPWGIAQAPDGGFIVVDSGNHRVVHWAPNAETGTLVAAGNGRGSGLSQVKSPCGVALVPK